MEDKFKPYVNIFIWVGHISHISLNSGFPISEKFVYLD